MKRERKQEPKNRDYDIVKLHAVKSVNIAEEMRGVYRKRIDEKRRELDKLMSSELPSRWLVKQKQNELEKLVKESKQDFHTAYLLDAFPILNEFHRNTCQIQENPGVKKYEVARAIIVDTYLRKFYPNLMVGRSSTTIFRDDKIQGGASECCNGPTIQTPEGSIVCVQCGVVVVANEINLSNPSKNLSYNRSISPAATFSYKRINHLRELLRQSQGKTSSSIPPEVLDMVKEEMSKSTLSRSLIRAKHVKAVLKRLRLHKYYEQTVSLTKLLNPEFEPITMTPEYEERIILMFVQLEKPFERIRATVDKRRKNFCSYPFVLYRLNQLNERDDLNRDLKLLKSITLINRQDKFWRALMKEVGWDYMGNTIA